MIKGCKSLHKKGISITQDLSVFCYISLSFHAGKIKIKVAWVSNPYTWWVDTFGQLWEINIWIVYSALIYAVKSGIIPSASLQNP